MSKNTLTEEKIGLDRISPSGLDCYEQCPKLFYYTNWLGLRLDQDLRHMDFGTAIHEALGQVYTEYDQHFGGGWIAGDFENVKKCFLQHWKKSSVTQLSFDNFKNSAKGREADILTPLELYEYMKEDGLVMLQSYWDNKERLLVEYGHDLAEFEIADRVPMHNPADPKDKLPIPLSLRVDAINRDRTVFVDFKTSGSKYNPEETRKKIQGQCYLFWNLMKTGNFVGRFDYSVLRKELKSPDRIEVVQLEYDEADMVALYIRIKSILQKIANREFNAPLKGHSPWCQCKEFEEKLKINKK
jgi:hypothetical protein